MSCNLIIALSSFVHLYTSHTTTRFYPTSFNLILFLLLLFPYHLFNSWFNLVPTLPFYSQKILCIYFSIIMLVQLKASLCVLRLCANADIDKSSMHILVNMIILTTNSFYYLSTTTNSHKNCTVNNDKFIFIIC